MKEDTKIGVSIIAFALVCILLGTIIGTGFNLNHKHQVYKINKLQQENLILKQNLTNLENRLEESIDFRIKLLPYYVKHMENIFDGCRGHVDCVKKLEEYNNK